MGYIRSGELREQLTIQAATSAAQAGGGNVRTWADVGEPVWAQVDPVNGGEAFAQGIARNTQFYRVIIRWRDDVTPANRLLWNCVPLNIRTCADPDRRREALLISAESGAAEPA